MDPVDLIAQGKIKRFFRARQKLTHPKIISHITQRAAGKEPAFLEEDDYLAMLALLKDVAQKHGITIFSFCLMPNHIHLLVRPDENDLKDAMRDLFSRYAMIFNRKYQRKGHLFGGPYRQAVCLDDAYLLAASVYIHLNPVRAGLVSDARAYRWSSIKLYDHPEKISSFVDSNFILRLISDDRATSHANYRVLTNKAKDFPCEHVLEQEGAIERFKEALISIFPGIFKKMIKGRIVARISKNEIMNMEELERRMESVKQTGEDRKPDSRQAKIYLIEQLIARGYKRSEIADRLEISVKTVYNLLKSDS
jgi:putative transposase